MALRTWTTEENSQGSFAIDGNTLEEALRNSLPELLSDARPNLAGKKILSAAAEWRLDILGGQGGAEVLLVVQGTGDQELEVVCWVHARPDDLPHPVSLAA